MSTQFDSSFAVSTVPVPRPDPECVAQFATQLATVRAIATFGGHADIVFLGDSITQGWTWMGESWRREWAPRQSLNLGIGGDQTQHLLFRIENSILEGIRPRAIVQLIGVNNIWSQTADQVIAGVSACLRAIRHRQPEARMLSIGVLPLASPHGEKNPLIADINRGIATEARLAGADFIDASAAFFDSSHIVPNTLMPDGVHLSGAGYERLTEQVLRWLG